MSSDRVYNHNLICLEVRPHGTEGYAVGENKTPHIVQHDATDK